jgi:hypothetical protein
MPDTPATAPGRMSTRAYPLEIEEIVDQGEDLIGVYSKGHHAGGSELTGDPFLDAARNYLSEAMCFDAEELVDLDETNVRFETWRCVPTKLNDERIVRWVDAIPGRPGAFPVTVLRLEGPA